MRAAIPRMYQSFQEFEREELRKLDSFTASIEDMMDDMFAQELDFGETSGGRSKRHSDDD